MTASLLARIPIFSDLPIEELDHLTETLKVIETRDREILFRDGDPGEHLYIVVDGILEVLIAEGTPDELLINVLEKGEYLGEMGLVMPGGKRTATVRSRGKSVLLVMAGDEYSELLQRHPTLAYSMIRVLSERLDATNNASFRDLQAKNQQLQTAYDELKAAQEQLVEKERLERELQVAAGIQMSILPDVLPASRNFDFGARISPARMVGGDFYDVLTLGEDAFGVLVGDVADKGIPAAIFMARAHALIIAESFHAATPGHVLQEVNAHITRLEKTPQFVTALYGHLNCKTGEFGYARAGHEPPLFLTADGRVERLAYGPGMSLGLMEQIVIDIQTITIPPGATLLLYSDGMTDCRNPQREPYGLERIKEKLSGLSGVSAQGVCDQLLETLVNYQEGAPQDDDVTLVAVHASQD